MEMLEIGDDELKYGVLNCALEDSSTNPSIESNHLTCKFVQVEGDGTFITHSEDDVMEVEHLLAEPQNENALRDVMSLNSEHVENCLAIEDFPTNYYIGSGDCGTFCKNKGIFDSDIGQAGERELKYEFADSMLHKVTEGGSVHVTSNLSAVCPDYLLETVYTGCSQQDEISCKGSSIANLGLECQFSSFEKHDEALEMLKFPNPVISQPESPSDQCAALLDNMSVVELHDAFRDMFGQETSVDDKQWIKRRILFGLQNIAEIDNRSSFLENRFSLDDKEDSMILIPGNDLARSIYSSLKNIPDSKTSFVTRSVGDNGHSAENVLASARTEIQTIGFDHMGKMKGSVTSSKRLRKPTRRYIEETSETKGGDRLEAPVMDSKDKDLIVRTDNRHFLGRSTVMPITYQVSPAKSGVQVPCGRRVRRGRPRKNTSPMGNDSKVSKEHKLWTVATRRVSGSQLNEPDSHDDMSDDSDETIRNEKSGIRRKHHRLWTLAEVMKLVEGVSQYGVGRWTDIKRLLFSTSPYRTSVDLKDKWRNLLRASGAHLHGRHKAVPQKQMTLPIPQTVLRRVKELAVIHPYPRVRKSRLTATKPVVHGDDTLITRSRRTVHRRSCTLVT